MARRLGIFILAVTIALGPADSFAAAESCPTRVEEVARFEQLWAKDFSRFPGPADIEPWLRKELLSRGHLTSEARALLERGASPLALDRGIIRALQSAYRSLIEASPLPPDKKLALTQALSLASLALEKETPVLNVSGGGGDVGGNGGDGGDGGDGAEPSQPGGGDDELRREIERHLRNEGLKRCVVRTAILFFVSNLINTAGALQAKWAHYAGGESAIDGIFHADTWQRALADNEFRHNVTWNAFLMLSLGALSCSNQKLGKNLMTGISALTSVAGQYLTTGEISVRQTLVDALFVRWISINKSNFVFGLAESYGRRGLPAPHLAEALFQSMSEGLGAYLYPRVNGWSKAIWKN